MDVASPVIRPVHLAGREVRKLNTRLHVARHFLCSFSGLQTHVWLCQCGIPWYTHKMPIHRENDEYYWNGSEIPYHVFRQTHVYTCTYQLFQQTFEFNIDPVRLTILCLAGPAVSCGEWFIDTPKIADIYTNIQSLLKYTAHGSSKLQCPDISSHPVSIAGS